MIRPGDTLENPVTGERLTFRRTASETNGARCWSIPWSARTGSWPPRTCTPTRPSASRSSPGHSGSSSDTKRSPPAQARAHDRARHSTQVLERGGERAALRRRDHAGARVRVADRDDVWPRRGRQDQPQGPPERAPARRDRQGAFRHGAAAISAGSPSGSYSRSAHHSAAPSATSRPTRPPQNRTAPAQPIDEPRRWRNGS